MKIPDAKNRQEFATWSPSHKFVGLYLCNKGMYRQSEQNLLNSNTSPTCPYNMVNFCLLAADTVSLVWGTPANFNGFRVLAALLHDTLLASAQLCGVEHGAPPIFGRAAITLGIGPHSCILVPFLLFSSPNLSGRSQIGYLP